MCRREAAEMRCVRVASLLHERLPEAGMGTAQERVPTTQSSEYDLILSVFKLFLHLWIYKFNYT